MGRFRKTCSHNGIVISESSRFYHAEYHISGPACCAITRGASYNVAGRRGGATFMDLVNIKKNDT